MISNGKFSIDPSTAFFKRDRDFLMLLHQTVSKHCSNTRFDLRTLSAEMKVSERQIQRKVRALLGCTPSEYLRTCRLQRSVEFLNQGMSVREVAQAVGFTSQSYFASCFKARFGLTPTQYQKRQIQRH